ncbi:hypothetical protein [Neorhodopirellula pilleata]|uniref:Uncharacterized protein n=1 Tax=Neorhodopirellula pilleata TaxID=2714738 RepID=A0A5C6AHU7_9BACT|nr:hypothetical protein [Neorhodopirellula pilleata]TWT98828.1 hypothetical protein Pla100_19940 [Neorhodopirellula pilleata]
MAPRLQVFRSGVSPVRADTPSRPDTLSIVGTEQLSYAAGSTSLEPDGYRRIGKLDGQRLGQLVSVFPELEQWIRPDCLIINAYPAALGLQGFAPLVDTYLHGPTLIRSLRLAAREQRSVIFAAQPLVGANMLIEAIAAGFEFPSRLLWAGGGYYFPRSLEKYMEQLLHSIGCQVRFLHCYGVAEVAHTCFAATERFDDGLPRFRKVVEQLEIEIQSDGCLILRLGDRQTATKERIEAIDNHWRIQNGPDRLSVLVFDELESWGEPEWTCRTGYFGEHQRELQFQLRQGVQPRSNREHRFHIFWDRFGGSIQSKPQWGDRSVKRHTDGQRHRFARVA